MRRRCGGGQVIALRINDRVHLVGSGRYGFLMTNELDCNVYLLDGGLGEYALVDAGGGVEPERIAEQAARAGFPLERAKYVLLTHVHGDHAAGAAFFAERYGIPIVVSAKAAPWLATADPALTSIGPARDAGAYPADYRFPGCAADVTVEDGDTLALGELELRVIDTEGHSDGHVGYWFEDEGRIHLFAGDSVFAGGKVVIQHIWDCSIPKYAATADKLHRLRIDALYPGHGPFLMHDAYRHVDKAYEAFRRLDVPPNL